jgi:hypothetical protein
MVGRYRKRTGHKRYNTCVGNICTRRGKKTQIAEIFKWVDHKDDEDINPAKAAQVRVQWWPFVVEVINRGAP